MAQKSVKMLASVGGELSVVGRCHPGEARLLRKNGLAEWKDGAIILNLQGPGQEAKVRRILEGEVKACTFPSYHEGLTEEQGLKIKQSNFGFFLVTDEGAPVPVPAEERTVGSVKEWFEELAARRTAGHELDTCDDPKARMMGFVDDTTNEILMLPLTKIKMMKDSDLEGMSAFGYDVNDVRELFRTTVGRNLLIGKTITLTMMEEDMAPFVNKHVEDIVSKIKADFEPRPVEDIGEDMIPPETKARIAERVAAREKFTKELVQITTNESLSAEERRVARQAALAAFKGDE